MTLLQSILQLYGFEVLCLHPSKAVNRALCSQPEDPDLENPYAPANLVAGAVQRGDDPDAGSNEDEFHIALNFVSTQASELSDQFLVSLYQEDPQVMKLASIMTARTHAYSAAIQSLITDAFVLTCWLMKIYGTFNLTPAYEDYLPYKNSPYNWVTRIKKNPSDYLDHLAVHCHNDVLVGTTILSSNQKFIDCPHLNTWKKLLGLELGLDVPLTSMASYFVGNALKTLPLGFRMAYALEVYIFERKVAPITVAGEELLNRLLDNQSVTVERVKERYQRLVWRFETIEED